ncbi:MAG: SDR family NAD(P)-dependent oxidoreductase [Deltaproteobacteria bacterium]
MKDFAGKIAIITGAGTGMGRELARQLASEGCHLSLCDILLSNLDETQRLCEAESPAGTRITTHEADVSDEAAVLAFRDAALAAHGTKHVNLVFNNAGIGGAPSIVNGDREQWEKVFNVCWFGVYYGTRAFLPALVASEEGYLVNTSSINGFWACLGPDTPHSAYSAAKFAVKGFTEALVTDLRLNAPHVKTAIVMPGHIGTAIMMNSRQILGHGTAEQMTTEELTEIRKQVRGMGIDPDAISDADLRAFVHQRMLDFQDKAPTTAASAATIILDGVRAERWRILVGDDAEVLDRLVREDPEGAYDPDFLKKIHAGGHLNDLAPPPGDGAES